MKIAAVIGWKLGDPSGLRCYSNGDGGEYARRRTERDGNDPQALRLIEDATSPGGNGVWVFWPAALGAFPDAVTLLQWAQEYDAEQARIETLESSVASNPLVAQLKAMTNAEFNDWWSANVTNAAEAINVLKLVVRVILRRLL